MQNECRVRQRAEDMRKGKKEDLKISQAYVLFWPHLSSLQQPCLYSNDHAVVRLLIERDGVDINVPADTSPLLEIPLAGKKARVQKITRVRICRQRPNRDKISILTFIYTKLELPSIM